MIFAKPSSEHEAVSLLKESQGITRILGGGTDVLVQMKSGVTEPELIVDIKSIPGIKEINQVNGGYEIGAAVSGSEFNNFPGLKEFTPGIAEAFDLIGSSQIQGRCTLAGNLCNASPAADTIPAPRPSYITPCSSTSQLYAIAFHPSLTTWCFSKACTATMPLGPFLIPE